MWEPRDLGMRSISCVCVSGARHGKCVLQCRREALMCYLSLLLGLCDLLSPARACAESTREHSVRNKHRLSDPNCARNSPVFSVPEVLGIARRRSGRGV